MKATSPCVAGLRSPRSRVGGGCENASRTGHPHPALPRQGGGKFILSSPFRDCETDSKALALHENQCNSGENCWIISASRRSDIPAFFPGWLMERIRAGEVEYRNPFGGQTQRVSLRPEKVHSIVFWSKDYRPLLPHLSELEAGGYRLSFHFTITGLPRLLEPNVPETEVAVETFSYLSQRFSPKHAIWRFDPIVFSSGMEEGYYLEQFARLGKMLRGKTRRCYFSFVNFYAKVKKNLAGLQEMKCYDPPLERKRQLAARLAEIAADMGMELFSCCADALIQPGVKKGHCIGGELLAELFPERPRVSEIHPTRDDCGCYASRDIGTYGTCRHGCLYCYATGLHLKGRLGNRFTAERAETAEKSS